MANKGAAQLWCGLSKIYACICAWVWDPSVHVRCSLAATLNWLAATLRAALERRARNSQISSPLKCAKTFVRRSQVFGPLMRARNYLANDLYEKHPSGSLLFHLTHLIWSSTPAQRVSCHFPGLFQARGGRWAAPHAACFCKCIIIMWEGCNILQKYEICWDMKIELKVVYN